MGKNKNKDAASFIAAHHPEKPSAIAQPSSTGGRSYSISVAIPGSIALNAQTQELRAWLAGQIARSCAIFNVDEIVVYKDSNGGIEESAGRNGGGGSYKPRGKYRDPDGASGGGGHGEKEEPEDPATFLARILEYLETPQYLRKALFPLHPSLRLAGLLPPLDCPHHLRRDDLAPYREGVTVSSLSPDATSEERPSKKKRKNAEDESIFVDVGLWDPIEVIGNGIASVPINTRVTVKMPDASSSSQKGGLVSPSTPTATSGLYWGYTVRVAQSLAHVMSESPYAQDGGYDLSIGTSERGTPIETLLPELPSFRHLLLTFGPLSGLELTIAADPLIPLGAEEAGDLFDYWTNVVVGQGSRTVRTEEAVGIALARMKTAVEEKGR